jgi:hypothetical protein
MDKCIIEKSAVYSTEAVLLSIDFSALSCRHAVDNLETIPSLGVNKAKNL